jgi:Chromate transporter
MNPGCINSNHTHGTHVPVEEPSTASIADIAPGQVYVECEAMTTRSTKSANWLEVLDASLRLGLTSFGGPIAHLGYFRDEYVVRRKWLDEKTYADLVALCQFLPGPASSQVGSCRCCRRQSFRRDG